jgi:hypothetical protein
MHSYLSYAHIRLVRSQGHRNLEVCQRYGIGPTGIGTALPTPHHLEHTPTGRVCIGGTRQAPTRGKVLQGMASGGVRERLYVDLSLPRKQIQQETSSSKIVDRNADKPLAK